MSDLLLQFAPAGRADDIKFAPAGRADDINGKTRAVRLQGADGSHGVAVTGER